MRLFGSHSANYPGWPTAKLNEYFRQTAKGMQCCDERSADTGDSIAKKNAQREFDIEEIVAIDECLKSANLYAFNGFYCVGYTKNATRLLASGGLRIAILLLVQDFRRVPVLDRR